MNPYNGVNFYEFFLIFLQRLPLIFQPSMLVEDELQIYTLCFTGISAVFVATFLILQKKILLANSISHTILLGIVALIALIRFLKGDEFVFDSNFSFGILIFPALVASFFTHYLTNFFIDKTKIQEDASIGITFTFLFALSVFIVSFMNKNSHLGIEAVMGNIDAIAYQDCKVSFFVFLVSLFWTLFCLPLYTLLSFDRGLARIMGLKIGFIDATLMFLCSLILITGFKSVGVVMILALMTFPILTVMFFVKSISKIIGYSVIFIFINSFISVALSRAILSSFYISVSTAGLVVLISAIVFFSALLVKKRFSFYLLKR